jgi:thymidylate synthase
MNTSTESPHADDTYLDLMRHIRDNGKLTTDRTGTGTRAVLGTQMRFDLRAGFPLLTTKKVAFRSLLVELCWFIAGRTDLRTLLQGKCTIWSAWPHRNFLLKNGQAKLAEEAKGPEWDASLKAFERRVLEDDTFAAEWGELGPVYGYQWRRWQTPQGPIDQLQAALDLLTKSPDSRRIIVSAWNPADIEEMTVAGLPPCHCLFQFDVLGKRLSCSLYQRSGDFFLGVPFNIASYAALTHLVARHVGLEVGDFIWTGGNTHLYENHADQVELQLGRQSEKFPMPRLAFAEGAPTSVFDIRPEHILLEGYQSHPAIRAPVAV